MRVRPPSSRCQLPYPLPLLSRTCTALELQTLIMANHRGLGDDASPKELLYSTFRDIHDALNDVRNFSRRANNDDCVDTIGCSPSEANNRVRGLVDVIAQLLVVKRMYRKLRSAIANASHEKQSHHKQEFHWQVIHNTAHALVTTRLLQCFLLLLARSSFGRCFSLGALPKVYSDHNENPPLLLSWPCQH